MPTYFIGLNILLTRQGGDFFILRIIIFILFLYPGRFRERSAGHVNVKGDKTVRSELTGIHQQNY